MGLLRGCWAVPPFLLGAAAGSAACGCRQCGLQLRCRQGRCRSPHYTTPRPGNGPWLLLLNPNSGPLQGGTGEGGAAVRAVSDGGRGGRAWQAGVLAAAGRGRPAGAVLGARGLRAGAGRPTRRDTRGGAGGVGRLPRGTTDTGSAPCPGLCRCAYESQTKVCWSDNVTARQGGRGR